MNEEEISIQNPPRETPARQRLLLVDDDASIRKVLAMGFQLEGFDILQAADGRAALDLLQHSPVDVVIVDLMMPVMDGVTFIRTFRSAFNEHTPIFMLTSFDSEGSEEDAMQAGATALIRKPCNISGILKVLREHV